MGVGIDTKDGRCNSVDEKWPESVNDVDAVLPQMGFADECCRKADSRFPADGEGGIIVWVDVVLE